MYYPNSYKTNSGEGVCSLDYSSIQHIQMNLLGGVAGLNWICSDKLIKRKVIISKLLLEMYAER